jgi:hypothetical protein
MIRRDGLGKADIVSEIVVLEGAFKIVRDGCDCSSRLVHTCIQHWRQRLVSTTSHE